MSNADLDMYAVKQQGRENVQFFEPEMNARVHSRVTMEQALREALSGDQFVIYYHPLIDIASRRILGHEALVRWEHPTLGLVSPRKFIPAAENSGLIVPLGEHILRTVCEQVVRWRAEGVPVVPVAVNWSAIQLQRQSSLEVVRAILDETAMDPQLLTIEIPESALMRGIQHAYAHVSDAAGRWCTNRNR